MRKELWSLTIAWKKVDNPYHEDNDVDDSGFHDDTINAWVCYLDNGGLDKYYMLTLTMICLSMAVKNNDQRRGWAAVKNDDQRRGWAAVKNDDQRKGWAAAEQIEEVLEISAGVMWQWWKFVETVSLNCKCKRDLHLRLGYLKPLLSRV